MQVVVDGQTKDTRQIDTADWEAPPVTLALGRFNVYAMVSLRVIDMDL